MKFNYLNLVVFLTLKLLIHARNISILTPDNSWIINEDFELLIKLSFPFSRCNNIFVLEDDVKIDEIFNKFIKSYKFNYYVKHQTYECQGFFLISSSVNKLLAAIKNVPTKISTSEILMVIDDTIDYTSELLNVTLYGYSNINVVSRSAMWSLSENYLFPRRFKNVSRIEEMKHQSGIVDLEGRELQVAAFFNPPLCYLFTAVNRTVDGIDGQFFTAPENEIDGIETKLFVIIAERLNFTWLIRKPNHYYRYGRPNGTNWYGGMIGQLFRNEIDVAFSGIWLKHDHYRFVNLTKPWHQLFINYLVPRPKHRYSFWALTRPLTPGVWLAIFGMIFLQSLNVYAKAWIIPHAEKRYRSYITTLIELVARLVGTWAPKRVQGFKIQTVAWHMAGVLIVTAYSCSLATDLTFPDFEKRIDRVDQFILKNLTWGRESPVPKFDDYFNLNDKYASQFPKKFQLEKSPEERHKKIIQGNYAIVGRMIDWIFFPENNISSEELQDYRVMKQSVGDYYVTFAVKPWLVKSFDKVITYDYSY
ncbi:glutamate receptor ionotropic, kainate glr-3 [Cotesia typhae]|uniref:glutamate receptor ionotropic, kainate glr-3 n=1 Tax=Cotesia typhae TaxID=2053667 RepID=UPI003D684664